LQDQQINKKNMENFKPFDGLHCETTATGTLLLQLNIELSEPMLFGLGEGLGFIFWNMKNMNLPFLGGRIKPDALTENIARNLNLDLTVKETSSQQKAWDNVKALIDKGQVVGLKLDCLNIFHGPFILPPTMLQFMVMTAIQLSWWIPDNKEEKLRHH
jgi:hypothetical protein